MGWTSLRSHLRELFGAKAESASDGSGRERKMSSSSTGSMKSKWLKAFKSLKTTGSSSSSSAPPVNPARESERKNGRDAALGNVEMGVHDFQEYTYKKITPCDVCSQVLRGHARQGVKCRLCKMNVHVDCKERVGRCTAKGRLLRRQKSSSEIESRLNQEQDEKANAVGSAAGTRPFGKPLVLSLAHDEEEDAAAAASPGSPGSHSPHSPLPMSPVAAMLSARNAKLNGPALRRN